MNPSWFLRSCGWAKPTSRCQTAHSICTLLRKLACSIFVFINIIFISIFFNMVQTISSYIVMYFYYYWLYCIFYLILVLQICLGLLRMLQQILTPRHILLSIRIFILILHPCLFKSSYIFNSYLFKLESLFILDKLTFSNNHALSMIAPVQISEFDHNYVS